MALVGMSAAGKSGDDRQRRRLVEAMVDDSAPVAERYADGSAVVSELRTNLVMARG